MHTKRLLWPVALFVIVMAVAPVTGDDDPTDEKNWLNEMTWPAFVADRRQAITEKDDDLTKLLKERFNAGQRELRNRYIYWLQGSESLPQVYDAARRVITARLEVGGPNADTVAVLKEKAAFARVVEKQAEVLKTKFNRSQQISDAVSSTFFRADAEVELLRAERAAKQAAKG